MDNDPQQKNHSSSKRKRKVNGVLLLNKPMGMSSNTALQKTKQLFEAEKAGHTGALDPLATGLLPICFGAATKFSHYLLEANKRYRTTIELGCKTATGDREGEIIARSDVPSLTRVQIEHVLQQFLGSTLQTPPMYSALKQQGKTLYQLARQGIIVDRPARPIYVSEIKLLHSDDTSLTLEISCSKGTYIRVLGEDIAEALGTYGHLSHLHRLATGHFELDERITLAHLAELDLEQRDGLLLPLYAPVAALPRLELPLARVQYFIHGQESNVAHAPCDEILVFFQQHCLGLARIKAQRLIPLRVLVTSDMLCIDSQKAATIASN